MELGIWNHWIWLIWWLTSLTEDLREQTKQNTSFTSNSSNDSSSEAYRFSKNPQISALEQRLSQWISQDKARHNYFVFDTEVMAHLSHEIWTRKVMKTINNNNCNLHNTKTRTIHRNYNLKSLDTSVFFSGRRIGWDPAITRIDFHKMEDND